MPSQESKSNCLVTPEMVKAALDKYVQYTCPNIYTNNCYAQDVEYALKGIADDINRSLNDSLAPNEARTILLSLVQTINERDYWTDSMTEKEHASTVAFNEAMTAARKFLGLQAYIGP